MYRNDITVEQRQYLLQAIEFVRLAAERARKRKALRAEWSGLGEGYSLYEELAA